VFSRSQKIFPKHFFIGIALAKGTVAPDGSFRRTKNKPTNLIIRNVAIYGRGGIGKSTTNNTVTCPPEMGKKAWLSVAIPREKG